MMIMLAELIESGIGVWWPVPRQGNLRVLGYAAMAGAKNSMPHLI